MQDFKVLVLVRSTLISALPSRFRNFQVIVFLIQNFIYYKRNAANLYHRLNLLVPAQQ